MKNRYSDRNNLNFLIFLKKTALERNGFVSFLATQREHLPAKSRQSAITNCCRREHHLRGARRDKQELHRRPKGKPTETDRQPFPLQPCVLELNRHGFSFCLAGRASPQCPREHHPLSRLRNLTVRSIYSARPALLPSQHRTQGQNHAHRRRSHRSQ